MKILHKNAASLPVFIASDGCILSEVIHPIHDGTTGQLSLARAALAPGKATHPHTLEFVEIYYVISGEGRMHLGEETTPVGADSCVYAPPRTRQWLENTSKDKDLVFLCVCHPAYDAQRDHLVS